MYFTLSLAKLQRECGPEGWLQGNKVTDDDVAKWFNKVYDIASTRQTYLNPPTLLNSHRLRHHREV